MPRTANPRHFAPYVIACGPYSCAAETLPSAKEIPVHRREESFPANAAFIFRIGTNKSWHGYWSRTRKAFVWKPIAPLESRT